MGFMYVIPSYGLDNVTKSTETFSFLGILSESSLLSLTLDYHRDYLESFHSQEHPPYLDSSFLALPTTNVCRTRTWA